MNIYFQFFVYKLKNGIATSYGDCIFNLLSNCQCVFQGVKFIAVYVSIKKKRSRINNLTSYRQKRVYKTQNRQRNNIIKTRMEINNIENGKTTEKIINETKYWFLKDQEKLT